MGQKSYDIQDVYEHDILHKLSYTIIHRPPYVLVGNIYPRLRFRVVSSINTHLRL